MSTLLQQLTARNLQHYGVAPAPSFESGDHEYRDNEEPEEDDVDLDSGFDDDNGLTIQDLEAQSEELDKQSTLHESFESLLVGTLDTYGVHGLSSTGAELYRLSVESLFRQYGYEDFDKVIVPSFEDSATREEHAEKVEEKGSGLLKRIWEGLIKAYETFTTAIGDFFRRIFTGAATLEKAVKRLKEKAANMGDKDGGKVNVGVAARYLISKAGNTVTGSAQVHELMSSFSEFSKTWINAWEGLTDQQAVKDMGRDYLHVIDGVMRGNYMLKRITDGGNFHTLPLPNHVMEIEASKTEMAKTDDILKEFKVSKMEFGFTKKPTTNEVDALDKHQVHDALESIEKALVAYRKLDTELQKRIKATKAFIANVRQLKSLMTLPEVLAKQAHKNNRATEKQKSILSGSVAMRSMIAASKVVQWGWSQVMTQFLQYLRANLKHVAASIKAAGKGEGKEKSESETKANAEKKDDTTSSEEKK